MYAKAAGDLGDRVVTFGRRLYEAPADRLERTRSTSSSGVGGSKNLNPDSLTALS